MTKTFEELNVSAEVLKALKSMNFEMATPVQTKSINPMSSGIDLMVQAPTGTGKTAAFGIPVIDNIDIEDSSIQSLVLCPTRELATQTAAVMRNLTKFKPGIRIQALYGGEPIRHQINALKRKPHIIVATPGRMIDHQNRHTTRLGNVKTVVLDEADRMLDMGFRDDMKTILDATPEDRQTVMFSATTSREVERIAKAYQKDAQMISIGDLGKKTVDSVDQYYSEVELRKRESTLVRLIKDNHFKLSIVFVSRKHMADDLANCLSANGIKSAALHGDMRQSQRNRVMARYKKGDLQVLVATDVAARGIDVENIDAVINFDMPQDSDSYVHRIGRTGRANTTGVSYSFITPRDFKKFRGMMRDVNSDPKKVRLFASEEFVSKRTKVALESEAAARGGNAFEQVLNKEKMYKERKKYDNRDQKDGKPAYYGRKTKRSRKQA
ncbi:MAG: DEAD/DEAH box helicase [Clostridiales Family XIII bacterium]|jgi:ATP-dependent RNA helicase DeaD|nr:DEAD/DEAH box helicase [Clostridiales Family XIII bacterium]